MAEETENEPFMCPRCAEARWQADLFLPGGLYVTCLVCGWGDSVANIERSLADA